VRAECRQPSIPLIEPGGSSTSTIAEKTVEDLGLTGTIEGIWMCIRPEEPFFIISIRYKEFTGKNTIAELGSIESIMDGVKITSTARLT